MYFSAHLFISQYCIDINDQCLVDCDGDLSCNFDSNIDATDCTFSCPCYSGCPLGCEDCPSTFCTCYDYETSPEYIKCMKYFESVYFACLVGCDIADTLCLATCIRDLDQNTLECPCADNCPDGCSCDNYECNGMSTDATTTTTMTTTH